MRVLSVCLLVLAAAVGGAVVLATTAPAGTTVATASTACGRIISPATSKLRIVGSQMQDSDGHVVVPYGVSLVSGPETKYWAAAEKAASAQIVAADRFWHVNAIRIQVGEALLLDKPTRGHSYNVPFASSVNRLVCQILSQGDIAIINDTTLFTTRSRGPTQRTVRFWQFMSRRYAGLPVIFDVFDEPRLGRNPRTDHFYPMSRVWRLWHNGGGIAGKRYLGMQALVDAIRAQHVDNVIWAEEPWFLEPEKLPTKELAGHRLEADNIVYAFHKVTLDDGSRSFRALQAAAAAGVPLVDSEWSQFAATNRPWECQDDAYAGVGRYFAFLRLARIGLMGWSLQPGALVKGTAGDDTVHDGNDWRFTSNPYALATPNTMQPDYGCNTASLGQGAGALLQDFFAHYSEHAPTTLFPKFG
jgi:Cellulase (glycosyl hydrolase family 5)